MLQFDVCFAPSFFAASHPDAKLASFIDIYIGGYAW